MDAPKESSQAEEETGWDTEMRTPKSSPVVIRFKKWKTILHGDAEQKPKLKTYEGKGPPAERRELDPENHRLAWFGIFGDRLRIDDHKGAFILDGQPIGLNDLMKKTNRMRKANGLEPIGRNPAWF